MKNIETVPSNISPKINPEISSFVSKQEGERHREITENPQRQWLVSHLVRGVINCGQVIKEGDRYYSHHQKMDNLEAKNDAIMSHQAEVIILRYAFQDRDHWLEHKPNYMTNAGEDNEMPHTFDKYYFYDFGKAFIPDGIKWENGEDSVFLEKNNEAFVRGLKVTVGEFEPTYYEKFNDMENYSKLLLLSKSKTEQLIQLSFNSLDEFRAVLRSGNIDLNDEQFNNYFLGNFRSQPGALSLEQREELMFKEIRARLELIGQSAQECLDEFVHPMTQKIPA